MPAYQFQFGDVVRGDSGAVVQVVADSEKEAIDKLSAVPGTFWQRTEAVEHSPDIHVTWFLRPNLKPSMMSHYPPEFRPEGQYLTCAPWRVSQDSTAIAAWLIVEPFTKTAVPMPTQIGNELQAALGAPLPWLCTKPGFRLAPSNWLTENYDEIMPRLFPVQWERLQSANRANEPYVTIFPVDGFVFSFERQKDGRYLELGGNGREFASYHELYAAFAKPAGG